jgi:hypothetical protein
MERFSCANVCHAGGDADFRRINAMKELAALAMTTVMLGGLSLAQAQNAPNSKAPISPNSINNGSEPGTPSGAESQKTATGQPVRISGRGNFCSETSSQTLNCNFASMSACEKQSKSMNLHCVANPNVGTTGSRH